VDQADAAQDRLLPKRLTLPIGAGRPAACPTAMRQKGDVRCPRNQVAAKPPDELNTVVAPISSQTRWTCRLIQIKA